MHHEGQILCTRDKGGMFCHNPYLNCHNVIFLKMSSDYYIGGLSLMSHQQLWSYGDGVPRLKVSTDRLEKPGLDSGTLGLYTMTVPIYMTLLLHQLIHGAITLPDMIKVHINTMHYMIICNNTLKIAKGIHIMVNTVLTFSDIYILMTNLRLS